MENNKDIVFMKREIKKDANWEKNPHLMFAIILIISTILFFKLMFFLTEVNCPVIITALLLIGMWIPIIYYSVKTNKKNLTKNGAFILRNKVLYYIELGYEINYQVLGEPTDIILGGPKFAHDVDIARQVQTKEKRIREARKRPETFTNALNRIINNNSEKLLPEGVYLFCEMNEFKIESVNEKEFTISYVNKHTKGNRVTQKYRNIYEGLIEYLQKNQIK